MISLNDFGKIYKPYTLDEMIKADRNGDTIGYKVKYHYEYTLPYNGGTEDIDGEKLVQTIDEVRGLNELLSKKRRYYSNTYVIIDDEHHSEIHILFNNVEIYATMFNYSFNVITRYEKGDPYTKYLERSAYACPEYRLITNYRHETVDYFRGNEVYADKIMFNPGSSTKHDELLGHAYYVISGAQNKEVQERTLKKSCELGYADAITDFGLLYINGSLRKLTADIDIEKGLD